MSIQLGKLFFENNFENVDEFDQQRKFVGVETGQSSVSGLIKICSIREKRWEKPECFFLARAIDHEDEANDKVHTLAIANIWVIECIGL